MMPSKTQPMLCWAMQQLAMCTPSPQPAKRLPRSQARPPTHLTAPQHICPDVVQNLWVWLCWRHAAAGVGAAHQQLLRGRGVQILQPHCTKRQERS